MTTPESIGGQPRVLAGGAARRGGFFHAIFQRILWAIFTLWGVSVIAFALLYIVPGDPAELIAGNNTDAATLKNIREKYGFDQPLYRQYFKFTKDLLTNNLESYKNDDKVLNAIARRFPATALLASAALTLAMLIAIPLGMLTARYGGGWLDRAALVLGILAISIPTFFLGRVLQNFLGYRWGLFSVGGDANLWNLPLPALTLGLGYAAYYARLLHANLRGVLKSDFIRAARARGLDEPRVLARHGLKNALIPLITILGMDVASLLSGLIFTEKIFAWPGIGSLAIDSINNRDVPLTMGTVMFSALMVVTMTVLVDIAYRLIDPRVRIS